MDTWLTDRRDRAWPMKTTSDARVPGRGGCLALEPRAGRREVALGAVSDGGVRGARVGGRGEGPDRAARGEQLGEEVVRAAGQVKRRTMPGPPQCDYILAERLRAVDEVHRGGRAVRAQPAAYRSLDIECVRLAGLGAQLRGPGQRIGDPGAPVRAAECVSSEAAAQVQV